MRITRWINSLIVLANPILHIIGYTYIITFITAFNYINVIVISLLHE